MAAMERLIAGARELGLTLSPEQVEGFRLYRRELVEWNERANLTAIVDCAEVQTRHFLDSLSVLLSVGQVRGRVLDVGAGAGFPGVPLKMVYPGIALYLVESRRKKADFLRHLVRRLGLSGVDVVVGRAEELAHDSAYRQTFDVVVSRAVARLDTLAELALPFCAVGGVFVAQKKGDIGGEVAEAETAIDSLGGRLREVRPVVLDELGGERYLVAIEKRATTPLRYPRRPGIPQKRPLGARS